MVTKPEDSRRNQKMIFLTTAAVTLVLALIVLFAALSPPSPEGVVSGMLTSLASQDTDSLEDFLSDSAQGEMLAASESLTSSRWRTFLTEGRELFSDFKIGAVSISGNEAEVVVYCGPGLIQEEVFLLQKIDRRWKVYGYEE